MKAGDKVVCVDDSPCKCGLCGGIKFPSAKNQVSVIRKNGQMAGIECIWLIGITVPHGTHSDAGINPARFRLLDELKQDSAQRQTSTQPATA